jgi:hypothetical protein
MAVGRGAVPPPPSPAPPCLSARWPGAPPRPCGEGCETCSLGPGRRRGPVATAPGSAPWPRRPPASLPGLQGRAGRCSRVRLVLAPGRPREPGRGCEIWPTRSRRKREREDRAAVQDPCPKPRPLGWPPGPAPTLAPRTGARGRRRPEPRPPSSSSSQPAGRGSGAGGPTGPGVRSAPTSPGAGLGAAGAGGGRGRDAGPGCSRSETWPGVELAPRPRRRPTSFTSSLSPRARSSGRRGRGEPAQVAPRGPGETYPSS